MHIARRMLLRFIGALACLLVAGWAGPIVTFVLVVAAFGLMVDGATLGLSRGGLKDFKQ